METILTFHGPLRRKFKGASKLLAAFLRTSMRRMIRGPKRPGWSFAFEVTTTFWQSWMDHVASQDDVKTSRMWLDAIGVRSQVQRRVSEESVTAPVAGRWMRPVPSASRRPVPSRSASSPTETHEDAWPPMNDGTVLYFRGGGFVFASYAQYEIVRLITDACGLPTFTPEIPLAPEHHFPTQLDAAESACRWMMTQVDPSRLVLAGDSAGGNLALSVVNRLIRSGSPCPAAVVCLSPWTDLTNSGASMTANAPYDMISLSMAMQWSAWVRGDNLASDVHSPDAVPANKPEVSPLYSSFAGFPPIYIQAGAADILFDMISACADKARSDGADVRFDVWPDMNHVFQIIGNNNPQSVEALLRIGEYVTNAIDREFDKTRTGIVSGR